MWGDSQPSSREGPPFAHSDPETEATHPIATIFSMSAQQLGLRPHGLSFWRLRGGCHLASSPIRSDWRWDLSSLDRFLAMLTVSHSH